METGYLKHVVSVARQTIVDCSAELERRKRAAIADAPPTGGDARLDRLERLVTQLAQSLNGKERHEF